MKKILLVTVAAFGFAGAASAADLPARMPVKAPPVIAPVFSWTGCYIGGFVGGAWGSDDATTYRTDPGTSYGYAYKLDSSFIGGGTVGCNWQPVGSPFVLGLEGEVGYMDVSGSAYDPFFTSEVSNTKVGDWYGIIAGRLGYSWDRALVYVKGGVAFVDVEQSIAGFGYAASTSETVATWTVGGGIEWAFDMNWSIKAEYMYIGLDQSTTNLITPVAWNHEIDGLHTAKVGLNYRFGGGAPLMARY